MGYRSVTEFSWLRIGSCFVCFAHRYETSGSITAGEFVDHLKDNKLDVYESMHRDTTTKITNKMHCIDYFIIPSQLYMFRAMSSSIIRST
jgi:hypothetical protein